MDVKKARRTGDVIEYVEYTGDNAIEVANWLIDQGAQRVELGMDGFKRVYLTPPGAFRSGEEVEHGMFVGFGDIQSVTRPDGEVPVRRYHLVEAKVFDGTYHNVSPRQDRGVEEVID